MKIIESVSAPLSLRNKALSSHSCARRPGEELRDLLFKTFLRRQHFSFPVESMGLSSIGIPKIKLDVPVRFKSQLMRRH